MDFESGDLDEDLRLAIHLSEIESQYQPCSKPKSSFEKEDYEYALKLSEELNSPNTSSSDSLKFSSDVTRSNDFFRINEFTNSNVYSGRSGLSNINVTSDVVDVEDYASYVRLATEERKDSSHDMKKGKFENALCKDHVSSDYELALRLAEEDLCTESSRAESVEGNNRNRLPSSQSLKINDLDVEMIGKFTTFTNKSRTGNNERKESPKNDYSNSYMNQTISVVDPSWEMIDPNPDIYALFIAFNKRFFWSRLDMVEVKWSPRMTLCAGICSYQKRAGHCIVKLSKPLLSYRPRKDLVETLLHEMIHAYLFVTNNDRDRDGHGVHFHQHMYRINKASGSNITVYHSFHDEVRMYKTHVWRCDGPCRDRKPFFGFVKRSMNRVPGPNDLWWADHSATCGGKFHKIQEPENYGKKKKKNVTTLDNWLKS